MVDKEISSSIADLLLEQSELSLLTRKAFLEFKDDPKAPLHQMITSHICLTADTMRLMAIAIRNLK